jgi:hypothetical protein
MGAGSGSVVRRSPFPVGDRWTVPRRSPLVIGGPFPGGSVDRSPVDRWTVPRWIGGPCAAIRAPRSLEVIGKKLPQSLWLFANGPRAQIR